MTRIKKCRGSITVEAAFIMPIFIFVLLSFLYFFQLFTLQEHIQESITRVSKEASQYGYVYNYITEKKEQDQNEKETSNAKKVVQGFVDGTLFRTKFLENMGDNVNDSCIMGGVKGISFLESSFMKQEDNIEVVAMYEVKIPVLFFNLRPFTVVQRVHSRAFVGQRLVEKKTEDTDGKLKDTEDTYVYITRTGTVYHKDKNCTYLKVKLISVPGKDLAAKRNASGAKYYPCESCMKEKLDNNKTYYITEYGTRYHCSSTCNKIERDVKKVKLSEVGSRKPCSKCGK
ncbi:MAG: pilus assembly protein [bacterium]|nr:pilus assembly protein [bacterium]